MSDPRRDLVEVERRPLSGIPAEPTAADAVAALIDLSFSYEGDELEGQPDRLKCAVEIGRRLRGLGDVPRDHRRDLAEVERRYLRASRWTPVHDPGPHERWTRRYGDETLVETRREAVQEQLALARRGRVVPPPELVEAERDYLRARGWSLVAEGEFWSTPEDPDLLLARWYAVNRQLRRDDGEDVFESPPADLTAEVHARLERISRSESPEEILRLAADLRDLLRP